jgi:hypothetical protein
LLAADDLDALLDEFLGLVNASMVLEAPTGACKLLVDFEFVAGLGLFGDASAGGTGIRSASSSMITAI